MQTRPRESFVEHLALPCSLQFAGVLRNTQYNCKSPQNIAIYVRWIRIFDKCVRRMGARPPTERKGFA